MKLTINDILREVAEGESEQNFEIDLNFHASFTIKAKSKEEAIDIVMEKARLEYGNEVSDYGDFTIEGSE